MEKERTKTWLLGYQPKTSFTVISQSRVVRILFEQITHISKLGGETIIHTISPEYCSLSPLVRVATKARISYPTLLSLQEILNDLPANAFFKIHRSHLVALQFIEQVSYSRIKVSSCWLPMSLYFRKQMIFSIGKITGPGLRIYYKQ